MSTLLNPVCNLASTDMMRECTFTRFASPVGLAVQITVASFRGDDERLFESIALKVEDMPALAEAIMATASSTEAAIGFSTSTCLPAAKANSAYSL